MVIQNITRKTYLSIAAIKGRTNHKMSKRTMFAVTSNLGEIINMNKVQVGLQRNRITYNG